MKLLHVLFAFHCYFVEYIILQPRITPTHRHRPTCFQPIHEIWFMSQLLGEMCEDEQNGLEAIEKKYFNNLPFATVVRARSIDSLFKSNLNNEFYTRKMERCRPWPEPEAVMRSPSLHRMMIKINVQAYVKASTKHETMFLIMIKTLLWQTAEATEADLWQRSFMHMEPFAWTLINIIRQPRDWWRGSGKVLAWTFFRVCWRSFK